MAWRKARPRPRRDARDQGYLMSDDELRDLEWLTWEWLVELAQSGSDNPEDGDCWISEPTKEGDSDE